MHSFSHLQRLIGLYKLVETLSHKESPVLISCFTFIMGGKWQSGFLEFLFDLNIVDEVSLPLVLSDSDANTVSVFVGIMKCLVFNSIFLLALGVLQYTFALQRGRLEDEFEMSMLLVTADDFSSGLNTCTVVVPKLRCFFNFESLYFENELERNIPLLVPVLLVPSMVKRCVRHLDLCSTLGFNILNLAQLDRDLPRCVESSRNPLRFEEIMRCDTDGHNASGEENLRGEGKSSFLSDTKCDARAIFFGDRTHLDCTISMPTSSLLSSFQHLFHHVFFPFPDSLTDTRSC
mmetsp:Transcript_25958/g.29695  ORF Transcript_25958/g.29695 Transcript_25958/m.29695 type:complete len:290 (+) Transcript_25958:235-1104(+)